MKITIQTLFWLFHGMAVCLCSCPWDENVTDISLNCACLTDNAQRLIVKCSLVSNFPKLITVLQNASTASEVTMLSVTNSSISTLENNTFHGLQVSGLELSKCKLKAIHKEAFAEQDQSLNSLGLQENAISTIPSEALAVLKVLTYLDLSRNLITEIPDNTFENISLQILNLANNQLQLTSNSFAGLETSLQNLNLKGCSLKDLPSALSNLTALTFLDLAQNNIVSLSENSLNGLPSLTALNLERNQLEVLDEKAFWSVKDTLTSLSLLNNGLKTYPQQALANLSELKVLDLGFNYLKSLPDDAFSNMNFLTLLAIDGNPMSTINGTPFASLNTSLRGFSLGGHSLVCDCNVRWIAEWIQHYGLQVTSRERNPQFCSQPSTLVDRSFLDIHPDELVCNETSSPPPAPTLPTANTTEVNNYAGNDMNITDYDIIFENITIIQSNVTIDFSNTESTKSLKDFMSPRHMNLSYYNDEVELTSVHEEENIIYIKWATKYLLPSTADVRVLYRLFGDNQFKLSKPLSALEDSFEIHKVPANEYFVVCVMNMHSITNNSKLEEIDVSEVPHRNCEEVRSSDVVTAATDKIIIIAATTAVCAAVIIAIIIFIFCHYQRLQKNQSRLSMQSSMTRMPILDPVKLNEADESSIYGNTIPRAHVFYGEQSDRRNEFLPEDGMQPYKHPATIKSIQDYMEYQAVLRENQTWGAYSLRGVGISRNDKMQQLPMYLHDLNRSPKYLSQYSHNTMPGLHKSKPLYGKPKASLKGSFPSRSMSNLGFNSSKMFKYDQQNLSAWDAYDPQPTEHSSRLHQNY